MKRFSIKKWTFIILGGTAALALMWHLTATKYMGIETETAEKGEIKNVIESTGVAVRDEVVLNAGSDNTENLKYLFSDGEKISKNGALAEVYGSAEEAKLSYKIDDISKEIEILEKLNLSRYNISKGVNFINKQINDEIKNLLMFVDDAKLLDSGLSKKKILYLLNEKQILLGNDINFDDRISSLKKEKESLCASGIKSTATLSAPESGEFISHTDGYENFMDYKSVAHSDFENFNIENIPYTSQKQSSNGKIIKSETWYIVCRADSEKCAQLAHGSEVKVTAFSVDCAADIPCFVESVVKIPQSEECILVISCDYMNKDLASIRKEEFKIELAEYSGIKINKNAIHKEKSTPDNSENQFDAGVYVRCGNYLKFKKIKPLYFGASEVVCRYGPEEAADENYLQTGDSVVTEGANLYGGKKL